LINLTGLFSSTIIGTKEMDPPNQNEKRKKKKRPWLFLKVMDERNLDLYFESVFLENQQNTFYLSIRYCATR
jgi:hypothetical protein